MNKIITLENLAKAVENFKGKLNEKADKTDIPSNPNLLDNPDFKINQRGINSYSLPSKETYTVDRWLLNTGFDLTVDNSGITLTVNGTATKVGQLRVVQKTGKSIYSKCTLSVYVEDMTEGMVINMYVFGSTVRLKRGLNTAHVNVNTENLYVCIAHGDDSFALPAKGDFIKIKWAKLEYGNVATPFVPPDPTTELLKCQRYYRRFGGCEVTYLNTSKKLVSIRGRLVPEMRTSPTVKLLDSVTYLNIYHGSNTTLNGLSVVIDKVTTSDLTVNLTYTDINNTALSNQFVILNTNPIVELSADL